MCSVFLGGYVLRGVIIHWLLLRCNFSVFSWYLMSDIKSTVKSLAIVRSSCVMSVSICPNIPMFVLTASLVVSLHLIESYAYELNISCNKLQPLFKKLLIKGVSSILISVQFMLNKIIFINHRCKQNIDEKNYYLLLISEKLINEYVCMYTYIHVSTFGIT